MKNNEIIMQEDENQALKEDANHLLGNYKGPEYKSIVKSMLNKFRNI